jgi:hypothetical protein
VKVRSPEFEKTLSRQIKKAVRGSPELKRQYRLLNNKRKQYKSSGAIRVALSFLIALVIWIVLEPKGVLAAMAVLTLWTLIVSCAHAVRLLTTLYATADLNAYFILPLSDEAIFCRQWNKFLRGSFFSMVDLLASLTAMALVLDLSPAQWLAVPPITILAWSMPLCIATFCVARFPFLPFRRIAVFLVVLFFLVVSTRGSFGGMVLDFFTHQAVAISLFIPTGWPLWLFHSMTPGAHLSDLAMLIPIAGFLGTFKFSLHRLRRGYVLQEAMLPQAPDILPDEEAKTESAAQPEPEAQLSSAAPEQPLRVGITEIEDTIRSRRFLAAPNWQQCGRLERLLWRWLTEREKVLSEFAFPVGISITAPWKRIARNFLLIAAPMAMFCFAMPLLNVWVLIIGVFFSLGPVLVRFLDSGLTFRPLVVSAISIPVYAGYAIGYREIGRFLFKCTAVQFPLLLLYSSACGLLVSWCARAPLGFGLGCGLKAGLLLFAGRLIVLTFSFSSGTNDSARSGWRAVILICSIVFFPIAFLALGAAGLFVGQQSIAWLLVGLAALSAYAFFRLYGWFYNRGWFDLMRVPVQQAIF